MQSNSISLDKEDGWCGVVFVQKSLEGEPRLRHLNHRTRGFHEPKRGFIHGAWKGSYLRERDRLLTTERRLGSSSLLPYGVTYLRKALCHPHAETGSLDPSNLIMLIASPCKVIGLRGGMWLYSGQWALRGSLWALVIGGHVSRVVFYLLKYRYKRVMVPFLSLEFGEDVMAGAVAALL